MARVLSGKLAAFLAVTALVSGCEELANNPFLSPPPDVEGTPASGTQVVEMVERDVEAPDVFAVNEAGLWDGRPSLGGVWVAHPDVAGPERVIIRNETNGTFVIGALFRRERDNPGPRIQVSSDAASELEMLAGQPTTLDIVALRREEIPVAPMVTAEAPTAETIEIGDPIEASSLDPVATAAAAAIESAESTEEPAIQTATAAPVPTIAPKPPVSSLDRPFIQIGIFSVEENATNTAASLRNIGIIPTVLQQESQGKAFWRVVVGPATTRDDRRVLLGKVRDLGFDDAYFVTN